MEDYSDKKKKKKKETAKKPAKKNYKKDHQSIIKIFQKKKNLKKRDYANITKKIYVRWRNIQYMNTMYEKLLL